ncbi:MAG: GNAT family N-acetyltransferase [Asgard group archaeon]|nr:GNAT family N-acetyltransferase [Asgard group archaeon]
MKDDEKELLDAIEYSIYMYGEVEGVVQKFKHEFLKGNIWNSIDFEEYNQVGMSRLPEDKVEEAIQEVINTYTSIGLTKIGWFVSPQSQPSNLTNYLEKHGFTKEIPAWGMTRSIQEPLDISVTDEFEFKELKINEVMAFFEDPDFRRMLEQSYGMPEGSADILRFGLAGALELDYTAYIAYEKETNKPVAFSGIVYIPNTNIALLGGAATLPEFRKRGIYTAMLKKRYEKAKQDNKTHLILQAKEATSAPIASKFGFNKICDIDVYVWRKNPE